MIELILKTSMIPVNYIVIGPVLEVEKYAMEDRMNQ